MELNSFSDDLVRQWDSTRNTKSLDEYSPNSYNLVWWICDKGHSYDARISKRVAGQPCPYCTGRRILVGYNDLTTTAPYLAADWHPTKNGDLLATQVMRGTNKKVWWLGKDCGHEWESRLNSRALDGNGCPYCDGKKVLTGYNDLASKYPEIAADWHPTKNGEIVPTKITSKNSQKVWWLGKDCGHEWKTSVSNRTRLGNNCSYCSGRKAIEGISDLSTTDPGLIKDWHPIKNKHLNLKKIKRSSHLTVWWKESCGHEFEMNIADKSRGRHCPYCSGQKVLIGFNDLASQNPNVAATWHPTKNGYFTPTQTTTGSPKYVWWLGVCGHEYKSAILDQARKEAGCSVCSKRASKAELKIVDHLEKNKINIEQHNRKLLRGKEIDIYLPDYDIAIEYNGLYWHTEGRGKDASYHYNKWHQAQKIGITLLHIWEKKNTSKNDIEFVSQFVNSKAKSKKPVDIFEFYDVEFNGNKVLLNAKSYYVKITGCEVALSNFINENPSYEILITEPNGSGKEILYKKLGMRPVSQIDPDYSFFLGGEQVSKYKTVCADSSLRIWNAGYTVYHKDPASSK